MTELADKIEAAEGPSRELDYDIARALGFIEVGNPTNAMGLIGRWYDPAGNMTDHFGVPRWTASLDAAMTLVPEGWTAEIWRYPNGRGNAILSEWLRPYRKAKVIGAATTALALCAAALRAGDTDAG